MNVKLAGRRDRAAQRLQSPSSTFIPETWNKTQWDQMLQDKLTEFLGLIDHRAISLANVEGAAANILVGAAKRLKPKDHEHWLKRFIDEGRATALARASVRA